MTSGAKLVTLRRRKGSTKWTCERMLSMAKARDNGGRYFVASSSRTVRDLERLFRQREVAGLLEECVGGIVGGFGLTDEGVIHIQIDYDKPGTFQDVLLCLDELDIHIVSPLKN